MRERMEGTYNKAQMSAVTGGLDGRPLVLIQGPPGTGKTKTILGLLSIIMHSAPAGTVDTHVPSSAMEGLGPEAEDEPEGLWARGAPWLLSRNPRDDLPSIEEIEGAAANPDDVYGLAIRCTARVITERVGPKAHVLVCAPSNSALDEIVGRILAQGLLDSQGRQYVPSVVRVGVNVHHSVQSVSLGSLMDTRISQLEAAGKILGRNDKDRIRLAILEEASIVCSTLSFSGSGIFSKMSRKFDVVVIDEAAQAVEPSILVPLCQGAKQVYLVGDPNQLPATVISSRAVQYGYNHSLFSRLQRAGYPVERLTIQYRMNPAIREFPSNEFYEGSLEDGPNAAQETERPWHRWPCFGPLTFFDLRQVPRASQRPPMPYLGDIPEVLAAGVGRRCLRGAPA